MSRYILLAFFMLTANLAIAEPEHHCAKEAVVQAKKLLDFHFGVDDRTEIDPHVALLKPIKNPAGNDKYDVLEVYGHIYKGSYRMRFIYGQMADQCLLVGQEILEMTHL